MSTAQSITKHFGGDWHGTYGAFPSPGHGRHDRGMVIRNAGCGDVLLHSFNGGDWRAVKDEARRLDLLPPLPGNIAPTRPLAPLATIRHDDANRDTERTAKALAIWHEATDPRGTLAETYLAKRGLALPASVAGDVIRFHARCPFGTERLPAMVALYRDIASNEPVAIHRTAITRDGAKLGRKMLGPTKGAAVMLTADADLGEGLAIAEGIETGLAVMAHGWPVWALGSAGAIDAFPVLTGLSALTVFADADEVGLAAARNAARRWADAGRSAFVQVPPRAGADFNDLIKEARHEAA